MRIEIARLSRQESLRLFFIDKDNVLCTADENMEGKWVAQEQRWGGGGGVAMRWCCGQNGPIVHSLREKNPLLLVNI